VALNLIPNQLENVNNPSRWEESCSTGAYDSYARQLGTNLVAAGLENTVIRLGPEMNGIWESDFVGAKKTEQKLWAKCFAAEVTSFREVAGEHFLFDWNVNACTGKYPYQNFYPGNKYVDIIGIDLYDVGCETPTTRLTFAKLASEPLGLNQIEAFAAKKGKPMSLPEWGLSTIPAGDDPSYINGIGSTFSAKDFAFESYFDGAGGPNSKAMALGPGTPLADGAFRQWFGTKQ
jgi:beta-mannanase